MAQDTVAGHGGVALAANSQPVRVRDLPIAEHGLIDDLHTWALVGTDSTIDWYCCPRFDSPDGDCANHLGLYNLGRALG